MVNLFQTSAGDALYNQLKSDVMPWHELARNHWNDIYHTYEKYLDNNFSSRFPTKFLSCLWELKLINYFCSLKLGNLELIQRRNITSPDFKWAINGKTYYIEAICPTKGSAENYPYLNTKLSSIPLARDGTIGHREYRERLTGAFREKSVCKYDPTLCDMSICSHEHKNGYKEIIKSDGFIIAISMADIDFINQPMNCRIDLSCFFPCSPYITMNIDQAGNVHDTYHGYNPYFNKGDNVDSPICVDIFGNSNYRHVSAVLISHFWQVLFPDLSKHELFLNFGVTDNDFMLVHNPFADFKLDMRLLPVSQEILAKYKDGAFTISLLMGCSNMNPGL